MIQPYSDKVLLWDRIEQAAAAADLRTSITDLEDDLRKELKTLFNLRRSAITPDEMVQRALLKTPAALKVNGCKK